jgi:hypothetical protein
MTHRLSLQQRISSTASRAKASSSRVGLSGSCGCHGLQIRPREKALRLSKQRERIDAILGYQFSGWMLGAALIILIVVVRLLLG